MNHLRKFRKEKVISQWRLARDSKVHQSRLSLSENDLVELTGAEKERVASILFPEKRVEHAVAEIFGEATKREL